MSLSVSSTSRPPGRSTRHSSATVPGRSVTCSRISPATTTSAQPSASGRAVDVARSPAVTPCAAACSRADPAQVDPDVPVAHAGAGAGRAGRRRSPRRPGSRPAGRPAAPARARAAASQCSIAKAPSGPPPLTGQVVVLTRIVTRQDAHGDRAWHDAPVTTTTLLSCRRARRRLAQGQPIPEPGGAVTAAMTLLAVGVGHRGWPASPRVVRRGGRHPARGRLGQRLAGRRPGPGGRADRQAGRRGRGRPAYGRHRGADRVAGDPVAWACRSGWPATRLHHPGRLVFALLYDWPLKSTAFSVAALPGGVRPAAGVRRGRAARASRRRRPGWSRPVRCSAAARTSPTCCPTWPTTPRTGVRGLPHRLGAGWSQVAAAVLLLAATLTLVFGPPGPPSWAGIAAVAGRRRGPAARVVRRPRARRPGTGRWRCSAR